MEIEAQNAIYLGEETGGRGRQFRARFLVPGLVKYDYGVCLLTKENADKFIQGFTGCPVVINHQNVTDDNVKDIAVGDIFSVWFDNNDGYYWCNGIIRDKEAIKLINEGYSVSCQYLITEYSDNTAGKLHNGNPYDKVIENGRPEHLAIVKNPRYEGAIIAVNAIMAQNEDRWITIHPNGEDEKGRHLLLKDGETPQEAIERQYGNGGQMTLGFPGAKKAQKDAKSYENKKITSRDKLYSVYMNDDVKEYGKKLVEALKEYNKYNDDGVNIDNIDDFVEKYEKQRDEEKTKTEYKKYLKEQSQKQSDTKDGSKDISKEEHAKIKEQVSKMSDDELVKAHFESQKGYESETPRAGSMTKYEAIYGEVAQELKRRTGRSFSTASTESEIKEALSKAKSDKEEKGEKFSEDFKKLADETAELEQKYLENPSTELAKQINKNRNKLLANKKYAELMYRKNIATPDTKEEKQESKKSDDDNIPKAYSRSEKTKLLYKYKTGKISRDEWIKETEKLNASNSFIEQFKDTLYTVLAEEIFDRLGE